MATPSKNISEYAEKMPLLLSNLKSISDGLIGVSVGLEKMIKWKADPSVVKDGIAKVSKTTNRTIELARQMTDLINTESAIIKEAMLFGKEDVEGLHKPENITMETAMRHKSPPCTARIGYTEARRRLYALLPADQKNCLISARQLTGCFGYRPSESHFVEFWSEASPWDEKKDPPIKTNGMLTMTARGFFFFQCEEFLKTYYRNYHVALIKGEIKAVSRRSTGRRVKFL